MRKLIKQLLKEGLLKEDIMAYHGSANDIDRFILKPTDYGAQGGAPEYGLHFGSLYAARMRMFHLGNEDGFMYKVNLDVRNLLRLDENRGGGWQPYQILKRIITGTDVATEEEEESYNTDGDEGKMVNSNGVSWWDTYEEGTPDEFGVWLGQWLLDKGYDGIIYKNEHEGGGDSYLIFNPELVNIISKKPYGINRDTKISDLPIHDLVIQTLNKSGVNVIGDFDNVSIEDFSGDNEDIKSFLVSLFRRLKELNLITIPEPKPQKTKELSAEQAGKLISYTLKNNGAKHIEIDSSDISDNLISVDGELSNNYYFNVYFQDYPKQEGVVVGIPTALTQNYIRKFKTTEEAFNYIKTRLISDIKDVYEKEKLAYRD